MTTTTTIAVHGASGRLGRLILARCLEHEDIELVAGLVSETSSSLGADLGEMAGGAPVGVRAGAELDAALSADIVIDVSLPNASARLASRLAGMEAPPALVCGVTGLDADQRAALDRVAARAPVLYARNFSLGAALMEKLAAMAAGALPAEDFDLEIVEAHHKVKADSPSGTAIAIGEAAARARHADFGASAVYERPRTGAKRQTGEIGFAALRGGAVVGEHSALFLGALEELEIRHRANDRAVFAHGAVEAALWLKARAPGLYTMADVLGL